MRIHPHITILVLELAAALGLLSCSSSPVGPSTVRPLAGSWLGTITDDVDSGTRAFRVDLEQLDGRTTGVWEWTFPDGRTVRGTAGVLGETPTTVSLLLGVATPLACLDGSTLGSFVAELRRTADVLEGRWSGVTRPCRSGRMEIRRTG